MKLLINPALRMNGCCTPFLIYFQIIFTFFIEKVCRIKKNVYICIRLITIKKYNDMNTTANKAEKVVNYTNARLANWYKNAKLDFNIEGFAKAKFNEVKKTIEIEYTENGITKKHIEQYWLDESIDYTFNVWAENAE